MTCATPPSDSEASIVPQGHAVKRCVVPTADQGAVRGAMPRDMCACIMAWLRAARAASATTSAMCAQWLLEATILEWLAQDLEDMALELGQLI